MNVIQKTVRGEHGKRGGLTTDKDAMGDNKPGNDYNDKGTGPSPKCDGCDKAGDIGCELEKLSCEFTGAAGDNLPMIAIGIGAVIVLFLVIK